jgi:hypothetical protein
MLQPKTVMPSFTRPSSSSSFTSTGAIRGFPDAITNEKENVFKKFDESVMVTLKLKGQQICAKLNLEKELVPLQRIIEAKLNGTKKKR